MSPNLSFPGAWRLRRNVPLAVRELASGESLTIEATDPAFEADLRAWSQMTGHTIEDFERGDVQRARIQVA